MLLGCNVPEFVIVNKLYSFFLRSFPKGFFFKGESHNFYEVVCVLEGKVGITAKNKVYRLKKGEAIYHPPGEFHAIWNEGDESTEAIIFSFSATHFPVLFDKVYPLSEEYQQKIRRLEKEANTYFDIKGGTVTPAKEIEAALTVKELEIFIASVFRGHAGYNSPHLAKSADLFTKILTVMEENIKFSLSVTQLAQKCNISVATLEKTVYKYLGYGAINHYNTLKMNRAYSLLLSGASVKETSLSLGFSNQNYFSARFKKHYGFAPSKIKDQGI